ncbi:uncharacterized protein LOC126885591 [Diabrotica virgifera virgifera]|uniref:Uncharacterized protein n=1 Tax=Diabrotica virgifera virgifera TaxID=50390 RepID=A0ABM5KD73_DIAVI|nr:uncharacterized protein LOC126885591 [Diabrotica virgifera virgifera]
MTLNHSKTWPVSTMAVVQLRVSPQGGQYEIIESERYEEDKPIVSVKEEDIKISDDGLVVPLLEKHLELFTKMASVPNLKTTIRTDTVSTILDPTDFDSERNEVCEEPPLKSPTSLEESVQKFHVLALARIEETGVGVNADDDCGGVDDNLRRGGGHHVLGRRPSIKVDNWDFIYTERGPETQIRCPVHHYALSSPNGRLGSSGIKDSLLPPELPLDARKTTTLRRHYYPEGGWGWVVATCAVLVHVLNHGVQLAYSQLVSPGTEKFRVEKVHFAAFTEKSSVEISTKDEQEKILEEEVEFLDTSEVIFDINDIPLIIDDTEIVNIPEMENETLIVPENEIFNMQGIEEYTNEAESSVTKTVREDQKTKKPEKSLNISENTSVNATNKSIATYLIWPDTPARKGKKQTQKLPFVLTSSDRRKIEKEKMEKKLEEERKKEQRKLKRKEQQSIKENQKKIKTSNNKKPKKLAKTFNKSEEKSRQPIEMTNKIKKGCKS